MGNHEIDGHPEASRDGERPYAGESPGARLWREVKSVRQRLHGSSLSYGAESRDQDHRAILLAIFVTLFAWAMWALLDLYFYYEASDVLKLFRELRAREIYSRVGISVGIIVAGIIISRVSRRLRAAESRAEHLMTILQSMREVNQHVIRALDIPDLACGVCSKLVERRGYERAWMLLSGRPGEPPIFAESGLGHSVARRIRTSALAGWLPPCAVEILDGGTAVVVAHEGRGRCADCALSDVCREGGSMMMAPLKWPDGVSGCVAVSPVDLAVAEEHELALLGEVSGDIAYAAHSMMADSERKLAEENLRGHRERLQAILDSLPAYIYFKDRAGRYLRVNRALIDATGIPQNDWYGRLGSELGLGEEFCREEKDAGVIESGRPVRHELEKLVLASGVRWVLTDRIPYRDDSGNVAGVIGLCVDITDRVEAEQALATKDEELRRAQKMEAVGQLAGGIAHDFNNVLTAIMGYADLTLRHIDPDDPLARNVSSIKKAAEQAASLTRQLLAFSRRQPLQLRVRDVNGVVRGTENILNRLIGEDIVLSVECDADLANSFIDPSQIEQVIMNLAINARDAMPEGGTLKIRTENVRVDEAQCEAIPDASPGEYVRISVADNGTGMDRETLSRIFEPFFTTKGPGAGTGLGLSVVYGNVRQHGGWIHVYSEPDVGTTFRVYLPATTEDEKAELESPKSNGRGDGERILLIEDEWAVRSLASKALRGMGYDVCEACSAEEALEVLQVEEAFDLIFSDVVLPGKSGVQLADELIERDCPTPILLSSGYADRKSQWPVICERGLPFIEKPYSIADLTERIGGLLASTRQ